jgi:hypothetical protein
LLLYDSPSPSGDFRIGSLFSAGDLTQSLFSNGMNVPVDIPVRSFAQGIPGRRDRLRFDLFDEETHRHAGCPIPGYGWLRYFSLRPVPALVLEVAAAQWHTETLSSHPL